MLQDVRFALRVLRTSPGFTLVSIVTLALAIGANVVVFGVMNGFVLRPLDVPQSENLYGLEHANEHSMYESYPDYKDLRDRNRSFDGLAGYQIAEVGVEAGDRSSTSFVVEATGNYFDVLRIRPALGRVFHASDEHGVNSAPDIVLGHAYWHTHFQDDPGVIGRVVRLNTHPFTIVGVAPDGFHGTLAFFNPDFYVPFVDEPQVEGHSLLDTRSRQSLFQTIGHLKSGVTPKQASADLDSVGAYLEQTYPKDHGTTAFALVRPGLYGNLLGEPMRAFMAGLMVLSGLVLLAACVNLGSLFAARASDRSREVALRLSLGAGRARILRQLITEAAVIALSGGAIGLWGSVVALDALSVWKPLPRFPIYLSLAPGARVYLLTFALAIASAAIFAIAPVRQVFRVDPNQVLKAGPSGAARRGLALRDLLLVAQISICAVLITASIVAARGLAHSLNSDFGFDPRGALLAGTDLSMGGYEGGRVLVMQKRIVEAVEAIPGVSSVGLIGRPPLNGGGFGSMVFADTVTDLRPANSAFTAERYQISPEYLGAARTVLLAGRQFTWHDDANAPGVAIVNRHFASVLFGQTTSAVGARFKLRDGTRLQVVGVVEDGKYENLTEDPQPALFVPMEQMPMTESWLVVRSNGTAGMLAASVRDTVRGLDPSLPLSTQTWISQLDIALFPARMATMALGAMGAIGAMLAVTGIFGMAAYSVSRRLKELGIRIALGARRKEVLSAALGRAIRLLAIGSAAGLLLGVLAARVLAFIVYQATPRDPIVLGGVVLAMAALGLVATWIPAQRALSVDPLKLLREE
ncbi:MAG: ABC transporter permease [Vicinamibacterales bacterium]